jgi:hypothetical protein
VPSSAALGRRESRLRDGVHLLHADLHNHTKLSDGAGDPEHAFGLIRAAGLDVAALTDHASIPHHFVAHLDPGDYPDEEALRLAQMPPDSLDAHAWAMVDRLADAADVPGQFTAIRGFEWTEPYVGHANVWFSGGFRDVHTPGRVAGLHDWLVEHEPAALFGYNHPGREGGRLGDFVHDARLGARMVSLEMFNRYDDYLCLADWSPLVDCLSAGWRPGLIGVSDEHGRSYGVAGKGRTGMWAGEHSRSGVRAALLARHTFATREVGLLLDATLDGVAMGGERRGGTEAELALDVDGGAALAGRELIAQLLVAGTDRLPAICASVPVRGGAVTRTAVRLPDAPWLVLRLADPEREERGGDDAWRALAYASPWWLSP